MKIKKLPLLLCVVLMLMLFSASVSAAEKIYNVDTWEEWKAALETNETATINVTANITGRIEVGDRKTPAPEVHVRGDKTVNAQGKSIYFLDYSNVDSSGNQEKAGVDRTLYVVEKDAELYIYGGKLSYEGYFQEHAYCMHDFVIRDLFEVYGKFVFERGILSAGDMRGYSYGFLYWFDAWDMIWGTALDVKDDGEAYISNSKIIGVGSSPTNRDAAVYVCDNGYLALNRAEIAGSLGCILLHAEGDGSNVDAREVYMTSFPSEETVRGTSKTESRVHFETTRAGYGLKDASWKEVSDRVAIINYNNEKTYTTREEKDSLSLLKVDEFKMFPYSGDKDPDPLKVGVKEGDTYLQEVGYADSLTFDPNAQVGIVTYPYETFYAHADEFVSYKLNFTWRIWKEDGYKNGADPTYVVNTANDTLLLNSVAYIDWTEAPYWTVQCDAYEDFDDIYLLHEKRQVLEHSAPVTVNIDVLDFETITPAPAAGESSVDYDYEIGKSAVFGNSAADLPENWKNNGYSVSSHILIYNANGIGIYSGNGKNIDLKDYITKPGEYILWQYLDLNKGGRVVDSQRVLYHIHAESKILSGDVVYTTPVRVGEPISLGYLGDMVDIIAQNVGNVRYQWQKSADGSNWTNISGADAKNYTPLNDEEYIRVKVTVVGYEGAICSAGRLPEKAAQNGVPVRPALTADYDAATVTILNYAIVEGQEFILTETNYAPSDWSNALRPDSNGVFPNLTKDKVYYVHTRFAETATTAAGSQKLTARADLKNIVYIAGLDLSAEKTFAASGEYVKLTVNPVPYNTTTFDGIIGSKWTTQYGASAKLYADTKGTPLIAGNYYKEVYLMGTDDETVTVTTETQVGYNTIYRDTVTVEIADAQGNFEFGAAEISYSPSSLMLEQGDTVIVELLGYDREINASAALTKPFTTGVWSSDNGLSGLSITRVGDTHMYAVTAADDCEIGKVYYDFTINGTKQTNFLTVEVTEKAVPFDGFDITPEEVRLAVGESIDLNIVCYPANCTDIPAFSWDSGGSEAVILDLNHARITGFQPGEATFTFRAGGFSDTVHVVVYDPEHEHEGEYIISDREHSFVCDHCGDLVTENHNYGEWTVTAPADCENDGTKTHKCEDCGYEEEAMIAKSGHTPAWKMDKTYHWQECIADDCDEVLYNKEKHHFDAEGNCEDCGYYDADAAESPDLVLSDCARDNTCPMYPFKDLDLNQWYHDGIHYCIDKGMMNGTSATTFAPNTVTSRAMVVTILWRLEGSPIVSGNPFTDVSEGQWYANAVKWAAANDIVKGMGNGIFAPQNTITREQMACIMYRYAQYKGYGVNVSADADFSAYKDAAQVSSWAQQGMLWAVDSGLINGTSADTLSPGGSAIRAQAATILYRFCKHYAID